jgi:hypothetical protein
MVYGKEGKSNGYQTNTPIILKTHML